ncbi:hypothetical protein ACFU8W_38790 [Streptomyces sp. NPDC057565]|uniref:hypothetical protein n=1 Tax=Streptomyces sp. NPDC057565 TaxID=3346169 RepID=UPI0036D1CFD7
MTNPIPACSVTYADGIRCDRPVRRPTSEWCEHCYAWWRYNGHKDPMGRRRGRAKGSVLAFVREAAHATTAECVILDGFVDRPRVSVDGKLMFASRAAWVIRYGDPAERHVLHTCHRGDEGCVNIRHLYLGDHARNMGDMAEAGRSNQGVKAPTSKLTDADVPEIRRLLAQGRTQRSIGKQFGVCRQTIGDIARGKTWYWLH